MNRRGFLTGLGAFFVVAALPPALTEKPKLSPVEERELVMQGFVDSIQNDIRVIDLRGIYTAGYDIVARAQERARDAIASAEDLAFLHAVMADPGKAYVRNPHAISFDDIAGSL